MKGRLMASALTLLLLWPTSAEAASLKKERYAWTELGTRINGRKVAFVLPNGTDVTGVVRGVEPGGLRIKVNKSPNPAVQPKREHLIPSQSLWVLRVLETGKKWRIICTLVLPLTLVTAALFAAGDLAWAGRVRRKCCRWGCRSLLRWWISPQLDLGQESDGDRNHP